jgi:hemoglobin-like flavoprotein
VQKRDAVDALAVALLSIGLGLFAWGLYLVPPASLADLVAVHFGDWTPGLVVDGLLLLVLNHVIKKSEKSRVLSQAASLSNEFALDAIRRCREEGWLQDGALEGRRFTKARLSAADLSEAKLGGADMSFADLTRADLTHADLRGADLKGANLSEADLRWADLTHACLDWSDLRGAQLDGSVLDHATADFASIDRHDDGIPEFANAVVGGFLTPKQVQLVETSFELLLAEGDAAIARFYERLFEAAPEVRGMFSNDIKRQTRKFLQSLKLIVHSLSSTERAAPVLERLGDRHRVYGVEVSHYEVVGGVLIDTLEEVLGDAFTSDVREAWTSAYQLISTTMS